VNIRNSENERDANRADKLRRRYPQRSEIGPEWAQWGVLCPEGTWNLRCKLAYNNAVIRWWRRKGPETSRELGRATWAQESGTDPVLQ
jgi:hypothetical protein